MKNKEIIIKVDASLKLYALAHSLHKLGKLVGGYADGILSNKVEDFSLSHLRILFAISQNKEANQADIAKHIGASVATMSRHFGLLEQHGYITLSKASLESISREHVFVLTKSGQKFLTATSKSLAKSLEGVFSELKSSELKVLEAMSEKIIGKLKK